MLEIASRDALLNFPGCTILAAKAASTKMVLLPAISGLIFSMAALLPVGLFLWCAWREYVGEKRRDAKLLAACGAGGVLAGAVLWLA